MSLAEGREEGGRREGGGSEEGGRRERREEMEIKHERDRRPYIRVSTFSPKTKYGEEK